MEREINLPPEIAIESMHKTALSSGLVWRMSIEAGRSIALLFVDTGKKKML